MITSKHTPKLKPPTPKYPKLMAFYQSGTTNLKAIVLATEDSNDGSSFFNGVVVWSAPDHAFQVGHFSSGWVKELWIDYDGSVTLENTR